MNLLLLGAAGALGWWLWRRKRGGPVQGTAIVDPGRMMAWPRQGIDPGALLPWPRSGLDPGR